MLLEAWRDQHPFEGPFIKLKRAEEHLKTIDALSQRFEESGAARFSFEMDAAGAFYECRFRAITPPPFDIWTVIGEFCYQLRSALDQAVFAFAEFPASMSDKERRNAERDTTFPVLLAPTPTDSGIRGRLIWIPKPRRDDIFKIVRDVQPYQGRDSLEALDHPLALLDELSNLDRHQVFTSLPVRIHIDTSGLREGIRLNEEPSVDSTGVIAWVPANLDPETALASRLRTEMVLPLIRRGADAELASLRRIHEFVAELLPRFGQFLEPLPPRAQS